MAQEIERKFLVKNDDFKQLAHVSTRIVQGYLSSLPERTVRIRIMGDRGFITVKGISNQTGISRFEWEREIPVADVEEMLKIAEPGVIDKRRYLVSVDDDHTFEVDKFNGENEGLIVAEIELQSENDHFPRPDWLGDEVTGDPRFYNSTLMKHPFKMWK